MITAELEMYTNVQRTFSGLHGDHIVSWKFQDAQHTHLSVNIYDCMHQTSVVRLN